MRRLLTEFYDHGSVEILNDSDSYHLKVDRFGLDRVAFEENAEAAIKGDYRAGIRALARWKGEPYLGFPWSVELQQQRRHLFSLKRQVELGMRSHGNRHPHTATKARPRINTPSYIQRPHLIDQLPKIGEEAAGLLTAPAGYGKSVAIAQWAASQSSPVAWVSLDELDNDPSRFVDALREAIASTGVPVRLKENLTDPRHLLEGVLVDPALAMGLVIDDLHEIVNPEIQEQVEQCVASPPPQFTLMIGSREPAPFRTARLEADGRLTRITTKHLRFSPTETEMVSSRLNQSDVAPDDFVEIHHQTEGWPIAVSYLARTGRQQNVTETTMTLSEYVLEEILSELSPQIASFLLMTAHLEQLTPNLCDCVTGRRDSAEILAWLDEHELFLVGDGSTPPRYHHLFAELLSYRANRDPGIDVQTLQRRAAAWYYQHDADPEAVLKYALQGKDTETILATSGDVLLRAIFRGEYEACRTWWQTLDPDVVRHDRRAHDIAMCVAIHWINEADRLPWVESRLRYYGGDDDVILNFVRATECLYQGRASEALWRAEGVVESCPEYVEDHAPDLLPIFLDQARAVSIVARLMQGTLDHEDPLLSSTHGNLSPGGPLSRGQLSGIWAFAAYVEGANDLATGLIERFKLAREKGKHLPDTSTVLGIITSSLLASDATDSPESLRAIAADLERELAACQKTGRYVGICLTRLALQRTYGRIGDSVEAGRHGHLATTLIDTFEDAPYVKKFRDRLLDGSVETSFQDDATNEATFLLTERERAVLHQLDSDLTLPEIAETLFISLNTVKTHTKSIYRKLNVTSRFQAIRRLANGT